MGKNSNLKQLARFMALAVAHKIGQLMNLNAIYAEKYEKEYKNFMEQAKNIKSRENWNNANKEEIKKEVKSETIKELKRKSHIDDKKFDIMDNEIALSLKELGF